MTRLSLSLLLGSALLSGCRESEPRTMPCVGSTVQLFALGYDPYLAGHAVAVAGIDTVRVPISPSDDQVPIVSLCRDSTYSVIVEDSRLTTTCCGTARDSILVSFPRGEVRLTTDTELESMAD